MAVQKEESPIADIPALTALYVYLTRGCNLQCRHCWISPGYQTAAGQYPALDVALFESIIAQAKPLGLHSVKLTGGEPLLHPDIGAILEVIRTADISLVIETNGVLCAPDIAQQIAACKNAFVSVSLDSVDASVHEWMRGVPGCFEAAKKGIQNLVSVGIKPQIIMTVMRRNKDQLEAIVRFAESVGAGSVKFNILVPHARAAQMVEQKETLSIDEFVALGAWVEQVLSASTPLRVLFSHPLAFRPLRSMFHERDGVFSRCGIMGILGVLADGNYALCGIGETVSEFVFGNAAQDCLGDIWRDAPLLRQLRKELPGSLEGICAECVMRDLCFGSCVAHNYYRSKNLLAPYWYCEEAHKRGLFPKIRIKPVAVADAASLGTGGS